MTAEGKTTPGAHRDAATKAAVIDRQPQPLKKKVAKIAQAPYRFRMSAEAVEFIEIFEALPVENKVELTDFARFLFERLEDDRWEKIVNDDKPRTKLEAFARVSEEEGSERLDFGKL